MLLCSCIMVLLNGQSTLSKNYTTNSGLPSNETYDLFQDKDGFIWVGTDNGAIRFDGNRMQTFQLKDGLADNDVLSIHQDSQGRIWFLSYNGKLSYWKEGIIFNEKKDLTLRRMRSGSFFRAFFEDKENNLWFGTNWHGCRKLTNDEQVKHFMPNISKSRESSSDYFFEDNKGQLWVICSHKVYRVEGEDFLQEFALKRTPYTRRRQFFQKEKELILFSEGNNISSISIETKQKKWGYSIDSIDVINRIEIFGREIYLATNNGVIVLNEQGRVKELYLKGKEVSDVLIDRENNLWVSTLNEGVFLIKNRQVKSILSDEVTTMLPLEDSLIIGGKKMNLGVIANDKLQFINYKKKSRYKLVSTQNEIIRIKRTKEQDIWAGCKEGLAKLENQDLLSYLGIFVSDFEFDDKEGVYIFSRDLILYLSLKELEQLKEYYVVNDKAKGILYLFNNYIIAPQTIQLTPEYFINATLARTTKFTYLIKDGEVFQMESYLPFFKGFLKASCLSKNGTLWFVDNEGSLHYYNAVKTFYSKLNKQLKYKNLKFFSVWLDNNNGVWANSNYGLFYITIEDEEFKMHGISPYLINGQVNAVSNYKDKIWLATSEGLINMPMETLEQEEVKPIFYIDSLVVDANSFKTDNSIQLTEKAPLNVHFTGIDYKNEGALTFFYQLTNTKGDTVTGQTKERNLLFDNLEASNYTLSMYTATSGGTKSNPITCLFSIQLQWWETIWAKSGGIFLLLWFSFTTIIYAQKRKKVFNKSKQDTTKEKEWIFVKASSKHGEVKILVIDILYVKASGDYIEIYLTNDKILVRTTMKHFLIQLKNAGSFVRTHHSYIVNLSKVDSYKPEEVIIQGIKIPISRANQKRVKELFYALNRGFFTKQ